jgi:hypothetical protein
MQTFLLALLPVLLLCTVGLYYKNTRTSSGYVHYAEFTSSLYPQCTPQTSCNYSYVSQEALRPPVDLKNITGCTKKTTSTVCDNLPAWGASFPTSLPFHCSNATKIWHPANSTRFNCTHPEETPDDLNCDPFYNGLTIKVLPNGTVTSLRMVYTENKTRIRWYSERYLDTTYDLQFDSAPSITGVWDVAIGVQNCTGVLADDGKIFHVSCPSSELHREGH